MGLANPKNKSIAELGVTPRVTSIRLQPVRGAGEREMWEKAGVQPSAKLEHIYK